MPLSTEEIARLRNLQKLRLGQSLTIRTEPVEKSISSDAPATPDSPIETMLAPIQELPIETLFPSIMVPRRVIRTLTHPSQIDTMLTVIPVFCSSLDSVLSGIHAQQFLLRSDYIYALLYVSIIGNSEDLVKLHSEMATKKYRCPEDDIEEVFRLVERTVRHLLNLWRLCECFHREKIKPLPPPPPGSRKLDDWGHWPRDLRPIEAGEATLSKDEGVVLPSSEGGGAKSLDSLVADDIPVVRPKTPPSPNRIVEAPLIPPTTAVRSKNPEALLSTIAEGTEPPEKPLPALPVEADDSIVLSRPPSTVGGKSLPPTPISDSTRTGGDSPTFDFDVGYSNSTELTEPSVADHTTLPSPGDRPAPTSGAQRPGLIQRLLLLHAEFSRPRPRRAASQKSKASKASKHRAPAIAPPDAQSFAESTTLHSEPREEPVAQQSRIYPTTDENIGMPLPAGGTIAVRLDSNGEVKAASLPALIQLLTSHHNYPVDDMCETFFLAFRLFSTPAHVLAALQARWDEEPPANPGGRPITASEQSIWDDHMAYVRNCLAQLIFTWLDEYWRPVSDGCILKQLRTFVKNHFPEVELVQGISHLVMQALDRAMLQMHTSRLQRAREVERQGAPPPAGPLKIVLLPQDDYRLNISVFETTEGRDRFAEQITALAHTHFRALDPEAAVAKWITGEPIFYELQDMEEAMLMFVAHCVLGLGTREERVSMIEFWLDVATICVDLRNFSSASAIFGGLVFSPVERLSLTILDVGIPSKEQYRQLNRLFDGANNYSVYRRALAENAYPAVPLIVVLRKDVISTNEISGPMALTNDPSAEKTLINFSAYRLIRRTICTMEACLVPFDILPVGVIQDWIAKQLAVLPRSEHNSLAEFMKTTSEQLEARAPAPIKKGDTWLQTVKGSIASGEFTLHELPDPGFCRPMRLAAVHAPIKLRKKQSIASMLNLRTRR